MNTEKTVESNALNAGETLRQLLKNKGLSQDKAARLADLRLGFLSRLIRGKRILEPESVSPSCDEMETHPFGGASA